MKYNTLENYYRTNFIFMQHYKWSLSDIDSMYPFERDLYIMFLKQDQEHQKEQETLARNEIAARQRLEQRGGRT